MDVKVCSQCKLEKPLNEFAPHRTRKNGVQSRCKICYAIYQRDYYRNRVAIDEEYRERKKKWRAARRLDIVIPIKVLLYEYLSQHPCIDCGESDPVVLEFDHTNPDSKLYSVSGMAKSESNLEKIWEEVSKCEIRCANCHRRRTAKQFNWYAWLDTNGT